jgi:tetratricopeptide (TPR) repeat protein
MPVVNGVVGQVHDVPAQRSPNAQSAQANMGAEPEAQSVPTLEDYRSERCTLEDLLRHLPPETDHQYELDLDDIALKIDRMQLQQDLKAAVRNDDDKVALAAFFCGAILLRRMKDFTVLADWIRSHERRFSTHDVFNHAWVWLQLERGDVDLTQSLHKSRELVETFPDNPGFLHLYADVVATAGELPREDETNTPPEDLDSALKFIQKAIDLHPYAKSHATKARLLALKGHFREALTCIETAIDQEDSSHSDYAIRIGNYQFQRLRIQSLINDSRLRAKIEEFKSKQADAERKLTDAERKLEEADDKLNDADRKLKDADRKLEELVGRLDDSIYRNLTFLGFFAALISFTIGSLQFAVRVVPQDAAGLMIVLMGALLVAFSGFSFILERHLASATQSATPSATRRVLLAGAVGLLACVGGAFVWFR